MNLDNSTLACPLCNSLEPKVLLRAWSFTVLVCPSCKNAWNTPFPKNVDYKEADFRGETVDANKIKTIDDLHINWRNSILCQAELLKKNFPKCGSVLEIGCGDGILLQELAKAGFDVTGLEPSRAASRRAGVNGLRILNDSFPSKRIHKKFDVIVMSHVLEHFDNPYKYLKLVKKMLKKNGALLLVQANFSGLMPKIQGRFWHAWAPAQHYWHFTPNGLEYILNKAGFSLIDLEYSSLIHFHLLSKLILMSPEKSDQFHALFKASKK